MTASVGKTLVLLFLVLVQTFTAIVVISSADTSSTIVKVDPALIEYNDNAVGEDFTVAIRIVNVTNLYGFDIRFRWNTTFLDYASHSVKVPRNTYVDGVLWSEVLMVKNEINATAGTYWIAYSSMHPAPSFNGTGTVFTMTLRVKHHPVEPEPTANIKLELYSTELVDSAAKPISHTTQDGTVTLYAITLHTRMYIDPRKTTSNLSTVYLSRPATYTSGGIAEPYYFHNETTTIGGTQYYLLLPTSGDKNGKTLSVAMGSVGRFLWEKTVFWLRGVASISAASWTFYYRTWFDSSPTGGTAYAGVDVLVRKADNTIRTTLATNVAKSTTALTSNPSTRSGTYSFPGYTVVDQTDFFEIDYYLEVSDARSKSAYLRIDDNVLTQTAQTRIANPTMVPFVVDPGNAYDGSDTTYASFLTNIDGTIDFTNFNTTSPGTNIAEVDLKIKFQALRVSGGDDRFRINQTVSPSPKYNTLQGWTTSNVEVPLDTYTWLNITEPNDGAWSWSDIPNSIVRFQTNVVGIGESREIRIYEVWIIIYDKPFTVNLRAELVSDLYNWSATVNWNPSIIDLTSLTNGSFLTGPEGTAFTYLTNRTAGYANLNQEIVGSYQGVTGAGTLAKITFKSIKEGKTTINLTAATFLNSSLLSIPHSAENGSFATPTYHDVAITNVIAEKNRVYQEETLLIYVVVQNKGTYKESFTVYCYANSTLICSQPVTNLTSGTETTIALTWNILEQTRGNYVLKATTNTVQGDYDTSNNAFVDSTIRVKLLGDVDDNGMVNVIDLFKLAKAYGSTGGPPPSSNWNSEADLDGDNNVNLLDLSALNRNYGKTV